MNTFTQESQYAAKDNLKLIPDLCPCSKSLKDQLSTGTSLPLHSMNELCSHQQGKTRQNFPQNTFPRKDFFVMQEYGVKSPFSSNQLYHILARLR